MKTAIKNFWGNEFYQGGVFITVGSFIVNGLNYLFSVFAAKSLGPKGFGEVSALLSYISVFSLPFTILSYLVIQKISAAGSNRLEYAISLEHLFIEKTKKLIVVSLPLLIFAPLLQRITNLSSISSYSMIPLVIFALLASFYIAATQGLRLFLLSTIILIGTAFFKLLGSFLAYVGIDGISTIILFLIISALFSAASCYLVFHNQVKHRSELPVKKIQKSILSILLSRQFVLSALSVIGISLFGTIDVIFVKKFFSAEVAGIYSSWSLLSKAILYAVGPLISVSFIFFSSKETQKNQRRVLFYSLIILALLMMVSYIGYTRFSIILINLFFGSGFYALIPYLGMASIFGSLYAGLSYINNYLLSKKSLGALVLPAALPFYALGLFFIPKRIKAIIQLSIGFSLLILIIFACCLYIFRTKRA